MDYNEEFSGVYNFSNPTNKDRKYLWNNKEYIFPAESTVPLIISSETLENIQEIRKRFAYRMAEERLYEGEPIKNRDGIVVFEYKKAKEMGGGIPPTFDDKILEPFIEECLKPLPVKRATITKAKNSIGNEDADYKISKAMGETDNPNLLFAEENKTVQKFGKMS